MSDHRFEISGTLRSMHSDPREGESPCKCCNGRPHVYNYGIDLPGEQPGTHGPRPTQPPDWIRDVLYPHRFADGARVTIALTIDAQGEERSPVQTGRPQPDPRALPHPGDDDLGVWVAICPVYGWDHAAVYNTPMMDVTCAPCSRLWGHQNSCEIRHYDADAPAQKGTTR